MSVDRIPLPGDTEGALWLCARRDIGPDPEECLGSVGAATAVCLNLERELGPRYPNYVEWLRHYQGKRALWFPVRDFSAESADATIPFLDMVVDRLPGGVVMHCALGQGRAGTMAVALLVRLGADLDAAVRTVAEHRAFCGPASPDQWRLVEEVAAAVGASAPHDA